MILIFIGLILLLNVFEVLTLPSWEEFWSYWPLLLVALGVFFLIQGDTGFFSFFLLFIGGIYSLRRFAIYPFTLESVLWPSTLIAAGVSFVLAGSLSKSSWRRQSNGSEPSSQPGKRAQKNARSADFLDESVFLSGKEFSVYSGDFKGGELSVLLGGMEVDLRHIKLTESASLFLRCTLGGLEVYLPPDVRVRVSGQEFLGGADIKVRADRPEASEPVLMIDYQVTLGGIDIIQ